MLESSGMYCWMLNSCEKLFTQQIPRHGQQQQTVAERQRSSGAPGDGDPDAHDVPQVQVLRHERVVRESFHKQSDGDHVEHEEVENVLSVLF